MPAEWEPIAAVWLAWPHSLETWPGHFERIPDFFASWAQSIADSTQVNILVPPAHLNDARKRLQIPSHALANAKIELVIAETNDSWIRDFGPTFVVSREHSAAEKSSAKWIGVDWRYNAWGGKYPPWDADDAAAKTICEKLGIEQVRSQLCLEGGAIETDGCGRLLTTPECLVTDTRNPNWTADQISAELHARLGVTEIVWLSGGGLIGDDTDGHIDQLARFMDPENVVAAVCEDRSDENYEPLEENYRQLSLWASSTSPKVSVHRLPIPEPRYISGQRVPESYCNFLMLGRDRLLMPSFGQPKTDDRALQILQNLARGAVVEALDCRDLIWGLGALHCASRDQPQW